MELTRPMSSSPASSDRLPSIRIQVTWLTWVTVLIFVLAVFTRFYMLGDRVMSHDESLHTKFSWDLYTSNVFIHTPMMHGPILFHATALNYFLFGDNDYTARIYPAVLGVLMVLFPLLFRRWLGTWGAILASVMILISPLLLYYNRYIREDTPSIFYTMVMVYAMMMYLDGPRALRRKTRWLVVFAAGMIASLATKETAFMYHLIFFLILFLYWIVRVGQRYLNLPGRPLFYFLALSVLIGGVAGLGFFVILYITPLDAAATLTPGTLENASLIRWTLLILAASLVIIMAPLAWAFRQRTTRPPWLDVLLMVALVVVVTCFLIIVEERSHVPQQAADAATAAQPAVPGQEAASTVTGGFIAWPFYALWIACLAAIAILLYTRRTRLWQHLYRFREVDIMVLMVSLILPWATPFVVKAMNPTKLTELGPVSQVVNYALGGGFDTSIYWVQVFLSALPVIPALALMIVMGMVWHPKRWLIAAGVFHAIFLFFFTTVFTNLQGIGTGMFGSLGYWLEQQAVRRGSQPQYYYLTLIMPFYEFLPVLGSVAAMFSGMGLYWAYRRQRREAHEAQMAAFEMGEAAPTALTPRNGPLARFALGRPVVPEERLDRLPFVIFVAWWSVFNLIAYSLAGEKMPWLGTHMALPMIFLTAWFFGSIIARIDLQAFLKHNWLYLLVLPFLLVTMVQIVSPFLTGPLGGLETVQLARLFQWLAGGVISIILLVVISRWASRWGWAQFRAVAALAIFGAFGVLTFRSAWMASYIHYDEAREYLVYAHGAPSNKRVTEQLQEWSERITGGMDLKFAYDFKISWPGAWYFRDFRNATFLGESPSPRQMEEASVVIVGDENRSVAETALEENYFQFSYIRMWWPMQDYFGLTAERVINVFDLTNPISALIRQGIFDIWWSRDYTLYGQATGKDFSLTNWPVADRMHVFVRKDLAAQLWDLGIGDGTAFTGVSQEAPNLCTTNWQTPFALQVVNPAADGAPAMSFPRAVALGPDGRLVVAEEFNHRISVFNPDGTFAFSFGQLGAMYEQGSTYFGLPNGPETAGVFNRPSGVAVGPSGNIYVADTWNFRVVVFNPEGQYITSWGRESQQGMNALVEPQDGFWGPRSIVVDSEERVYISDTGNKRVRVYDQNGQWLRDIGAGGSGIGQLDEPSGLALSADGLLYVADYWNRRISVFTLDGTPALLFANAEGQMSNSFRVRGWREDFGNRPYLAVSPDLSQIYIGDMDTGRVLVVGRDGECVGAFGQLARENPNSSQFSSVGGIAFAPNGDVWVTDSGSGRLLRFPPFTAVMAGVGSGQMMVPVEIVPEETGEATPEVTAEAGG